mmetsp:Transcript_135220/g.263367  ORF Transcript_135220/g.263367 Transcript_135220/m.263367 type:complete len:181 (-) Transcript_135220:34-576(-)
MLASLVSKVHRLPWLLMLGQVAAAIHLQHNGDRLATSRIAEQIFLVAKTDATMDPDKIRGFRSEESHDHTAGVAAISSSSGIRSSGSTNENNDSSILFACTGLAAWVVTSIPKYGWAMLCDALAFFMFLVCIVVLLAWSRSGVGNVGKQAVVAARKAAASMAEEEAIAVSAPVAPAAVAR